MHSLPFCIPDLSLSSSEFAEIEWFEILHVQPFSLIDSAQSFLD